MFRSEGTSISCENFISIRPESDILASSSSGVKSEASSDIKYYSRPGNISSAVTSSTVASNTSIVKVVSAESLTP